jgi:hypothetical protein
MTTIRCWTEISLVQREGSRSFAVCYAGRNHEREVAKKEKDLDKKFWDIEMKKLEVEGALYDDQNDLKEAQE